MGHYRSLQSLLFAFFLFAWSFFVYKGRIKFPDTDRQQSSETQEPFALKFGSFTVQMSYETSDVHVCPGCMLNQPSPFRINSVFHSTHVT